MQRFTHLSRTATAVLAALALVGCSDTVAPTRVLRSNVATARSPRWANLGTAVDFGPFSDWSEPVNMGPVINAAGYRNITSTLSPDGLSLYFGSDRPGGFGDVDFYVSHRESRDAPWGAPHNLGPTLNTPFHEAQPNFSPDGTQLFFNSNRPGGCGSQDLWVSRRSDVTDDFAWQAPVNLGCVINSAAVDQGPSYFEDPETGDKMLYCSSERPGGLGVRSIYLSVLQPDGTWGAAALIPELSSEAFDARPSIRLDGSEIFLFSTRPGSSTTGFTGIWSSTRETTRDAWSTPGLVFQEAAYPSISLDGTEL